MLTSLFNIFLNSLIFIFACSCKYNILNSKEEFILHGDKGKDAVLYLIKGEKNQLIPIQRIFTETPILIETGKYLIANKCSSYVFQHVKNKKSELYLNKVNIEFPTQLSSSETEKETATKQAWIFQSLCVDPIEGTEHSWKDKLQFDVLPGTNAFYLGGKKVEFSFTPSHAVTQTLPVSGISLVAPTTMKDTRFFVWALEHENQTHSQNPSKTESSSLIPPKSTQPELMIAAPLAHQMYVLPGDYVLEVNGSKQKIKVNEKKVEQVELGVLRVDMPSYFPMDLRRKAGGQPFFVYINERVLFILNTDYPVFPDNYAVSLEGSDLKIQVDVKKNERSLIKTRGVLIKAPDCLPNVKCKNYARITLHSGQLPFVLMSVPAGVPFLVFEGSYEYGVEGLNGIYKTLNTSADHMLVESLGRVKINWEVKFVKAKMRTDFTRFESRSGYLSGKSLDLMYMKQEENFLPAGQYQLTYFVVDSNQDRNKQKIDFVINENESKEFTIPVYTETLFDKAVIPDNADNDKVKKELPKQLNSIQN